MILYAPDVTALEKKAGQKAARSLSRRLKLILGAATTKQTGTMLKAVGATAIMKYGGLDHIAIRSTSAVFMQHYGFEGVKSNGVRMNMKPFKHFDKLFDGDKALDNLLDEISAIRGDEIMKNIRF